MLNLTQVVRATFTAIFCAAVFAMALPAPVAYWSFEDSTGTRLTDKSGRGVHGVITGPLTSVAGRTGKAFEFSGSTHITIPDSLFLPQSFTFSTWVWQSAQTADVPVLEFCCFNGGYVGAHLWLNANGTTVTPGNIAFNLRPAPIPANAGVNTAAGILTPNAWHHVVLTFDSLTRTATVFADKVARSTFTFSGMGNRPTVSGSPLYIGYRPATSIDSRSGVRYTGRMDEIRIYAASMQQAQVDSLFALNSPAPVPPDTTLGTLPPLVARWDFEDSTGTQFQDQSGNNAHGTLTGPLANAAGKWGKALTFGGSTHVEIPDALINLTGDFTISAWVWQSTQTQDQPVLEFCCPGSYSGAHLWVNTFGGNVVAGGLQVNMRPSAEIHASFTAPQGTISAGMWNLLTVTYSSVTRKTRLYANRILRDSISLAAGQSPGTGGSLYFGYRPQASADSRRGAHLTGRLDEVTVYAAELSQAQVNSLYFNTPPSRSKLMAAVAYWDFDDTSSTVLKDVSGHGRHGVISGTTAWGTGGPRGKALYFDGTTKVTVPFDTALGIGSNTWTAWFKAVGSGEKTLMHQQAASGWPSRRVWLSSGGKLTADYANDSINPRRTVQSTATITPGNWYQLAVTHADGVSKLYVDGTLQSTQSFSGGPSFVGAPLVLGGVGFTGAATPWTGWMDEVRVYARVLSSTEVDSLYYAAISTDIREHAFASLNSSVRLQQSGPRAFRLTGLGRGITARVDALSLGGRRLASWSEVQDNTLLQLPDNSHAGTHLLRIRTSEGKLLSLLVAWPRP